MANKNFMLVYQPKGDPFTHIVYCEHYEEALDMFYTIKKFHAAFKKPVRIDLTDHRYILNAKAANASKYKLHFDNTREEA